MACRGIYVIKNIHPNAKARTKPRHPLSNAWRVSHVCRIVIGPSLLLPYVFNHDISPNNKMNSVPPPQRTPLRRVSQGSLRRLSRSGVYPDAPHGLGFLEPALGELLDDIESLNTNIQGLRSLGDALSTFNESFASWLYVMNMNALTVDWPQVCAAFPESASQPTMPGPHPRILCPRSTSSRSRRIHCPSRPARRRGSRRAATHPAVRRPARRPRQRHHARKLLRSLRPRKGCREEKGAEAEAEHEREEGTRPAPRARRERAPARVPRGRPQPAAACRAGLRGLPRPSGARRRQCVPSPLLSLCPVLTAVQFSSL